MDDFKEESLFTRFINAVVTLIAVLVIGVSSYFGYTVIGSISGAVIGLVIGLMVAGLLFVFSDLG